MWIKTIKPIVLLGAAAVSLTLAPALAVGQQSAPPLQNGPYGAPGAGQMPARGSGPMMAPVGTINYIQGQVSIDGSPLTPAQTGRAAVQPNGILSTGTGKAEILLTPGVFLRVGDNARVRLISNDLAAPRVEIMSGEALIEVDRNIPNTHVDVVEQGANVAIAKAGLYRFNAATGNIAVYDGKLNVSAQGQSKEISGGHQLMLNQPKLKTIGFDKKSEDALYAWSNVRSNYLAEANASMAQNIYSGYSPNWGLGWYWDPYWDMWSWLPGDGYFWSPFGYPFFSVGYWPYYGGFYGRGGYGHGWYGHGPVAGFAGHAGLGSAAIARSGGFRGGGFGGGGFRGGGFAGGGFHGGGFGGGGFHGGGGGGGRR